MLRLLCLLLLLFSATLVHPWIQYPPNGFATMTHYSLPQDYVASCGCTPSSTHFPTAALSQMAFGSSTAYGPACGRCFNLTLLNTFLSDPPFYPSVVKSVVIKVTDLCPISSDWCTATESKPNQAGNYLNFDLAFPSPSIPGDFFPSNATLYGYTDFGVWNISYTSVSCNASWAGASDAAAVGSVTSLSTSGCCPADPTGNANDTCPSYSDNNGIPPNTGTSDAKSRLALYTPVLIITLTQALLISL